MSWQEQFWLLPVMVAIAVVLGAAGREGRREIRGAIVHTFVVLTLGVVLVGVVIHVIARVFA